MAALGSVAFTLAGASLVVPPAVRASMIDQIIYKKCSAAMQEDFQKAGKTAPDGMVPDTCNCVVNQIHKRQSIEQAKTFCSQQSLKTYGHP